MFSPGICRWLFLLVSLATWVALTNSKEMRVVCYYTNWSVYRPGDAKFSPQNINPYLCTHLIYAFGGFTKENTLKPFDKYQDIEKGGYAKFTGLKTYNKNLKTLLAIGGWNEGSARFSSMVASAERRKEFAKNAIKFLRLNHFDGLDLDWEYPSFRDGGKPRDRDNYPLLIQDLREEFDREAEKTGRSRLLLTIAVPAGIEYINKGFDVPKITRYVDWMNILSYDYHSAFEPSVNHHAPLYSLEEESEYNYDSDLNVHYSIKYYLKNGADPSKLVLGIPTYGRSYTLLNPEAIDIGSPADGPGSMGEATRENGYLAYYEICEYVKNDDWEVEQPNSKVMGPYAFKDNQWVGYDDEEIVKRKAEYVAENNLGGIMFWSIDNDDFRGKCHDKPYPLIEAGRAALLAAYGVTDDNLISPTRKPVKSRTRTRTKTLNKVESSDDEKIEKSDKLQTRRRNRTRPSKSKEVNEEETTTKRKTRRKEAKDLSNEETSSYSSLKLVTPSYTTPAPPATPDMDGEFKCEDDGFYPHPKDCKKYYWCLSGPGESGIVAHQFTCPAGLYFNKAADSCDYTQNVLCNKKMQKVTAAAKDTSSFSTTSSPSSFIFSTTRAPPKITAATSRTTFVQTTTTTTEAYEEDDEEYEDEEIENIKEESEEDPRVIKELIELIKKAGGLEELEKQFNAKGEASNNPAQPTTKSSLSKTLYERVLSKAIKNNPTTRPTTTTKSRSSVFRNSRGPQSEKTEDDEEKENQKKTERGKLEYTPVSRFRPSISRDKQIEEEKDDQDIEQNNESLSTKKATDKFPNYTNIRRARVSTTTTKTPKIDRNKILGEIPVEDDEEDDEETNDDDDDTESSKEVALTTKKPNIPQYVNIRRQRPSTTEEVSTARYSEIRRGTPAESSSTEGGTSTTSKYKQIRRGTTTVSTKKPNVQEAQFLSTKLSQEETSATEPSPTESGLGSSTSEKPSNETIEDNRNEYLYNITTTRTYLTTTDDNVSNETKTTEKPNSPSKPNLFKTIQRKRPQLLEPRPFSKPTEATTKSAATQTTKVSYEKPSINFRSRGTSRFNPKKTLNTTDVQEDSEIKENTSSKRRLSVTEKYIEDHRSYRPSELADLSSLTAVDFDNIKELHAQTGQRRRRPLKPSSTTTTTTEYSIIPFKKRRINVNLSELSKISQTTDRNTVTDSLQSTSRNRKIIRRYRPTTTSTTEPIETVKSTKSLLDVPPNNNEVDDDSFEDTSTDEYENIKLSESNIRENSDFNSFEVDPKLRNKFIKTSNLFGKSSVYDKSQNVTPDEKTSTAYIEVPSTTTTEATRTKKIIRKIIPTESSKITYVDSEQIFGRRRKIIRKFRPHQNITANVENSTTASNLKEISSEPTPEKEIISSNLQNKIVPKRIFRPRDGNRRFTPVTLEPEVTSTKFSQVNKTILLRGPNKVFRQRVNITTTTESSASSQRFSFIPRRTTKQFTSSTVTTEATSQPIPTTVSDEDIDTTTIKNVTPNTFEPTSEEITTETIITTEENDINSKYTEIPTTIENLETTSIKFEDESEFSTQNFEQTTDTPADTTLTIETTTASQNSTTAALQQSSLEYKSNILRPIESRPKFIPSKLKNLSNNENTEAGGFKPRTNYRNRLQSSTSSTPTSTSTTESTRFFAKSTRRYNKFRPGVRYEKSSSIDSLENSSPLSINKSLYTYNKRPEKSDEENLDGNVEVEDEEVKTEENYSLDNKNENNVDEIKTAKNKFSPNSFKPTYKPYSKSSFSKAVTEESKIIDALKDVNTDAVKTRNKNLFNNRKPNSNLSNSKENDEEAVEDNDKSKAKILKQKEDEDHKISNEKVDVEDEIKYTPNISTSTLRPSNKPYYFSTTASEESQTTEDLKDVDTEAVKTRNKNLFNNIEVNSNIINHSTSPSSEATEETTVPPTSVLTEEPTVPPTTVLTEEPSTYIYDEITTPQPTESTTLIHIFAEKEEKVETNQTTTNKVERLIEVNRIVNVKTKEDVVKNHHVEQVTDEESPVVDKIGAINRVTVIKVVDKDGKLVNETVLQTTESPIKSSVDMIIQIAKIEEVPGKSMEKINLTSVSVDVNKPVTNREERKLDLQGGKIDYSKNQFNGKAEIFGGLSHINIITPRTVHLTESSTIALEGLFQTEKPSLFTGKNSINDELLETENSKFVNVRVLHPDEGYRINKKLHDQPKVIPIKILKQDDDDYVMRAKVVEVSTKSQFNTFKIVPIKVEAAKRLPPPLPLIRINRQYN